MTTDELLDHFDDVRRDGHGHMVRCPACDGRRLSIQAGHTGSLLTCWSGQCDKPAIMAAKGLTVSDLFYTSRKTTGSGWWPSAPRIIPSAPRIVSKRLDRAEQPRTAVVEGETVFLDRMRDGFLVSPEDLLAAESWYPIPTPPKQPPRFVFTKAEIAAGATHAYDELQQRLHPTLRAAEPAPDPWHKTGGWS